MLPADFPYLSLSLTSVKKVHFVPGGKKKAAASRAMSQFSRKRIGTNDRYVVTFVDAAHSEGVIRFILRAVRHFIIERTETLILIPNSIGRLVIYGESEHLGERLLRHQ